MSKNNTEETTANMSNKEIIEKVLKELEEDREKIEKHLYDMETQYLEETHPYGNLIRGWEGYLDRYATTTRVFFSPSLEDA